MGRPFYSPFSRVGPNNGRHLSGSWNFGHHFAHSPPGGVAIFWGVLLRSTERNDGLLFFFFKRRYLYVYCSNKLAFQAADLSLRTVRHCWPPFWAPTHTVAASQFVHSIIHFAVSISLCKPFSLFLKGVGTCPTITRGLATKAKAPQPHKKPFQLAARPPSGKVGLFLNFLNIRMRKTLSNAQIRLWNCRR